jgi:hypothetical protein
MDETIEVMSDAPDDAHRRPQRARGFAQLAAELLDATDYGPSEMSADVDESCRQTRQRAASLNTLVSDSTAPASRSYRPAGG